MIGHTLSHYHSTEIPDRDGMGDVYGAEDTILGRELAIKVLPDMLAGNPARLASF